MVDYLREIKDSRWIRGRESPGRDGNIYRSTDSDMNDFVALLLEGWHVPLRTQSQIKY